MQHPRNSAPVWFLESMATQILVIFIIRSNGKAVGQPAAPRAHDVVAHGPAVVAMAVPFSPIGPRFASRRPAGVTASVGLITIACLVSAELPKRG